MTLDLQIMEPGEDSRTYDLYVPVGVPGDDGVVAAGHEPNGYFWESLLDYLVQTTASDLVDMYEPDSEADTFVVSSGHRTVIERLREVIAPYLDGTLPVQAIVTQAESSGFEFDD